MAFPNQNISSEDSPQYSSEERTQRTKSRILKTTRNQFSSKYERLRNKLQSGNSMAEKGEATELILEQLNQLESIYNMVQLEKNRDTRVQLMDAEALHDSSKLAAINAKNIKFGDVGISLNEKEFLKCLKVYMNPEEVSGTDVQNYMNEEDEEVETPVTGQADIFNSYNWMKLGALYFSQSNRPVSIDFLNGPLATERKRPLARQKNIDDTGKGPLTTARLVQASDLNVDTEKSTSDMVRLVYRTFNEKSGGEEYNFFKFFIDPRSFSQSVENLFFTSFLIRDGKVKLTKNKDGIPMIKICSIREAEEASTSSKNKTHHIATFDYQTWEGLIRTFDITESFLGHRETEADVIPSDDEANFEQSDEAEDLHNGSSQVLDRGSDDDESDTQSI